MRKYTVPVKARGPITIGGRILASLFFLVFGGMGLIFMAWLARDFYRDVLSYKWPATPCTILESAVSDKGGNSPYAVQVQYHYEWQGANHTSSQLSTKAQTFADYSKAQRLADRFRADSKAMCYVNPDRPTEAVLKRNSLWGGLAILLPCIFFVIGAGGLYFTWRKKPEPEQKAQTPAATPQGRKFHLFFWGMFFGIGSIASYFILVRPIVQMIEARDWVAVPCTVISSRVKWHSSDDGTTYSVDILYRYELEGREYKANRYTFLGGSSSGRKGKQKVVNEHPPGAKKVCYVNPRDPTDAVLHRGWSPAMFFGLIPLLFVGIGLAGIIGTLRKAKGGQPQAPRPMKVSGASKERSVTSGQFVDLKPKASPMAKFIGATFFTLFWNGILSVFLVQVFDMWKKGEGGFEKWFLTFFLIPFVLIGLGMIFFSIHSFFGLFSPRARLRSSQPSVALGESVELSWEFSGRTDKIRSLKLQLEGRNEIDEGSGKKRRTRTDVFYTGEIAHFTNINDVRSGSVVCTIPSDHAPSDADGARRVVWVIRLKAEVEMGADLDDEYPITVVSAVPETLASQ